jgi:P4 family phage/plasmid primase-like protien
MPTPPLFPPGADPFASADPNVKLALDRIIRWTHTPAPRTWPPDPPLPPLTPDPKRQLVALLEHEIMPAFAFLDSLAARSPAASPREYEQSASAREPARAAPASELTEADLVDAYQRDHQPTVFANGRFWRRPFPKRPWQPLPDDQVAFELLGVLQQNQAHAVSPSRARLQSVLELLRLRLAALVPPGEWDDARAYLPFPNLAIPLAGSPDAALEYDDDALPFVATTFPYDYDAAAECPHWLAFLHATVPHALDFVQEFAGYCLTAHTHHQLSLWLCGAPAGGKSTFLHGFQTLLGDFAGLLSLPDLARRRLDPAALAGKRLLIVDETPPDFTGASALVPLIDGTPFHLVEPHGLPFQVQTHAKLMLGFSGLPSPDGRWSSLYRRAIPLLFPPRVPGSDDVALRERIGQEGPGLFQWAWRGWRRLLQRGRFQPPATLLAAAERLRLATASPRDFIAQHCVRDPDARSQALHLNRAYLAWCDAQGIPAVSAYALAQQWRNLGFDRRIINGVTFWCGVKLVTLELAAPAQPPRSLPAATPDA